MAIADEFVAALEPWWSEDLQVFAEEIAAMFADVEALVGEVEEDDDLPWMTLFDPDTTSPKALGFLSVMVGERLPVGIGDPQAREWLKDRPNQRRGTLESVFRVAQRTLTGSRSVSIRERDQVGGGGDDPDRITVITYTAETPDQDVVERDLRDAVPADIVLNYEVLPGQTWNDVDGGDWQDVKDGYPTWREVFGTPSGVSTWSRPRPWV